MVQKVAFEQKELTSYIADGLLASPYYAALQFKTQHEADDFVAEMTLSALHDIFMSIPSNICVSYEDLFQRHADREQLFRLLSARGEIGLEEMDVTVRNDKGYLVKMQRMLMPSLSELCYLAYDAMYCDYRNNIEVLLTNILGEFNPYAELTYRIENNHHVITLGEDIRHKVFAQLYGDRYVDDLYTRKKRVRR